MTDNERSYYIVKITNESGSKVLYITKPVEMLSSLVPLYCSSTDETFATRFNSEARATKVAEDVAESIKSCSDLNLKVVVDKITVKASYETIKEVKPNKDRYVIAIKYANEDTVLYYNISSQDFTSRIRNCSTFDSKEKAESIRQYVQMRLGMVDLGVYDLNSLKIVKVNNRSNSQ